RSGSRRTCWRESGTRFDAASVGRPDRRSTGETDSSRAHGFRVEALSRAEAENRGRDFAYDGRDRQEHPLPSHAEVARGFGGYAMSSKQRVETAASAVRRGRSPADQNGWMKVSL